MKNLVKVGDRFDYEFGDETYDFPVSTVVICIYDEIAILKVTFMYEECVDLTLEYDQVVEHFPDFTDLERNMYSRYLFLDTDTMELFKDPYVYYDCEDEELETDCSNEEGKSKTEINEQQSYPDASSDDLPF